MTNNEITKGRAPVAGFNKHPENINRDGRPPKGYSITEMMREMLNSKPEVKEAIGAVIAAKAIEGDPTAIKLLWQYMDGMPQQNLDLTSKGKQIGAAAAIAEVESKLKQ